MCTQRLDRGDGGSAQNERNPTELPFEPNHRAEVPALELLLGQEIQHDHVRVELTGTSNVECMERGRYLLSLVFEQHFDDVQKLLGIVHDKDVRGAVNI
jgi:hypothetical protein